MNMKECPHCHERTFGPFQLYVLDYFQADYCKRCRKLVRNDGLRQLLMVPTILGALATGLLLLWLIPELPAPIFVLVTLALMVAVMIILPKPVMFEITISPFTPSLTNDK